MNELRKEFAKKFPEINKTIFKVRQLAKIMPISDDDLEYYELLNWFQQKIIEELKCVPLNSDTQSYIENRAKELQETK